MISSLLVWNKFLVIPAKAGIYKIALDPHPFGKLRV